MPDSRAYQLPKPAHELTSQEIKELKTFFGCDHLMIDQWGNIIETQTKKLIAHGHGNATSAGSHPDSLENSLEDSKNEIKQYFRKLPGAVKTAIIEKALATEIEKADRMMSIDYGSSREYKLSYKEMSNMIAEGILIGDDE